MNRVSSSLAIAALLVAVSTGLSSHAVAQTAPAPPPVTELKPAPVTATSWRPIQVKNVPPRVLASWLDPVHNSMPAELKPLGFLAKDDVALTSVKNNPFALPTGIESIFPVDAQNTLLVLGTEEGVQKLQDVLAFLDKPLRQVEIEAQVVEMKAEDYPKLGLDLQNFTADNADTKTSPSDLKGEGTFRLSFVRGNFLAQLEKLKAQNKARVLRAPRVTAINNQTANLTTTTAQPVVLATKDERGRYSELFESTAARNDLGLTIGREFKFAITPTINNDDTITLLIAPTMSLILATKDSTQPLILQNLGALQTVANVRDGDTVGLTGLTMRLASIVDDARTPPSNVVLFVTARIVRRAGEAGAKPVALVH